MGQRQEVGFMRLALIGLLTIPACYPYAERSPPQGTHYQQDQKLSLTGAIVEKGPLLAGWAKTTIQPPDSYPLAGYGDRQQPALGQKDPVAVRAFALSTGKTQILIFCGDLLLYGPKLTQALREQLSAQKPGLQLVFAASHSHSSLGGYQPGWLWTLALGNYHEPSYQALLKAHLSAAQKALSSIEPAKLSIKYLNTDSLATNRVKTEASLDPRLLLVHLQKNSGKEAALYGLGVHATLYDQENRYLSADWPGEVAQAFEGKRLEVLAFAATGVGSALPRQNPAGEVIRSLQTLLQKKPQQTIHKMGFSRHQLPLPNYQYQLSENWLLSSFWVEALLGHRQLDFSVLVLGQDLFYFQPAELSGGLTRAFAQEARKKGYQSHFFPFNGNYLGYVIPNSWRNLAETEKGPAHHYESRFLNFLGPGGDRLLMSIYWKWLLNWQQLNEKGAQE